MKKLLALLLIAVLSLTMLVACGEGGSNAADGELTTETIVGKWAFEMNLADVAADFMGMEGKLAGIFQFKEDGTASMYFDGDTFFDSMEQVLREFMTLEKIAQMSGISAEQLQQALAQQGLSWDEYMNTYLDTYLQTVKTMFPANDEGNIVLSEGKYKVEDGKIYISKNEWFTEDDAEQYRYEDGKIHLEVEGVELILTRANESL